MGNKYRNMQTEVLHPNKETIAAMQEAKKMKTDDSIGKTYSTVDELLEAILCDV